LSPAKNKIVKFRVVFRIVINNYPLDFLNNLRRFRIVFRRIGKLFIIRVNRKVTVTSLAA